MLLTYKFLLFYTLLVYELTEGQVDLLKCDFSGESSSSPDFCSWTPAGKNQLAFVDGKPKEMSALSDGPLSSRSSKGSFIQLKEKSAVLISPVVQAKQFCLSFYYYLFAASTGEIAIMRTDRASTSGSSEVIYYRNEEHENIDKWHHFQRTVNNARDLSYLYSIRTKREDGTQIAIDDIEPSYGACEPPRYYCDFDLAQSDELNCPWVKFETSDKAVSWTTSFARQKEYGIDKDHSSRSVYGKYLIAKGFEAAPKGTKWSIVFPETDSDAPKHCLSFWIFKNSAVSLKLQYREVGKSSKPIDMILKHFIENKPSWTRQMYTISKTDYSSLMSIRLEMVKLDQSDKPIGIDSILYSEGICPEPATCDFDENFCGFESSGSKWLIGKGRVANPQALGANFEPPPSTSRYAYVDLSLTSGNSIATLSSDEVPRDYYCLKWNEYHSKFDGRSFEIHIADSEGNKLSKLYERINNLDSKTWNSRAETILSATLPNYFRLLFVVNSNLGFTALDDIELNKGKCVNENEEVVEEPAPSMIDFCDFENGMCGWNSKGVYERWEIHTGVGSKALPRADTTIRSNKGHFAYLNNRDRENGKATLSKSFTGTAETQAGKYCFQMQSIVTGEGSQTLKVDIKGPNMELSVDVAPSSKWKLTQIDLDWSDISQAISISLEGQMSVKNAAITVDDIFLYKGACQRVKKHIYECGFHDYDNCDISIDRVSQGGFSGWMTKKMETHFYKEGNTIATEFSNPTSSGRTRFYMPRLRPRVKSCLTLWYLMKATEGVTFRVLLEKGYEREDDDQTSEVLFEASENNGDNWLPTRMEIADENEWRLAFEVEAKQSTRGNNLVAIDDIVVHAGACPSYYACDLEDDSCLWHNMKGDVRANYHIFPSNSWAPHLSSMVSQDSTFPKTTADGSQGYYFFASEIHGSSLLLSPRYDWPADEEVKFACLTFWDYFVDTDGGGTIFIADRLTRPVDKVFDMHFDGSPSHEWSKKKLEIKRKNTKSFWIIIYAYMHYKTSVNALDDIRFEFGKCPVEEGEFTCDNGLTTLTRDKVCNFIYDCSDKTDETQCGYNCDYSKDKNRCGWLGKPGQVFTVSETKDPESRVRIRGLNYNARAVFESPVFKNSISTCTVQFKASYGQKRVRLYAELSVEGQDKVEVWNSDYLQPQDDPNEAIAKFTTGKISNEFRIYVTIVALYNIPRDQTDLTLSTLEFDKSCVLDVSNKDSCPDKHFKCDNGRCIAEDQVCNLRDECGDNSDESDSLCKDMETRSCDFSSFCFFEDDSRNKNKPLPSQLFTGFEIKQGFREISKGPTRDNTDNKNRGWFAYLAPPGNRNTIREASMTAENVMSECASFFVYSRGDVTLKVNKQVFPVISEPIWKIYRVEGLSFHEALTITATTSGTGYLAIDDFSWGTKCSGKSSIPQELQIYDQLSCDFNEPLFFQKWKTSSSSRVSQVSQVYYRPVRDGPLAPSTLVPTGTIEPMAILFQRPTTNDGENSLMTSFVKMSNDEDICFTFDYYFFGNLGNFQLIQQSKDNTENYLFHRNQEYGNIDSWQQYSLNIPREKSEFKLVVSMNFGSSDATFAFDNFVATKGKCQSKNTFCDFDRSPGEELGCDWLTYKDNDVVKWSAKFPGKFSGGPAIDHSSKSIYGRYLTNMRVKSFTGLSKARLYLARAESNYGEHCLTFWYYRPEVDDDEISVTYETTLTVEQNAEEVLYIAKAKGKRWTKATVNLPAKDEDTYSFAIVTTKSADKPKSVVGLDSILLMPGACFEPLSCDFNVNFCGYTTASSNKDDPMATRWLIGHGRLYDPTQLTGQNGADYTFFSAPNGYGSFAYVDLTSPNLDVSTKYNLRLESDPWQVTKDLESTCLRFKYYLHGELPQDSSFSVKLYGIGTTLSSNIWTLEDSAKFQWVQEELDIGHMKSGLEIEIKFELDTKPLPFVLGLADVDITPGKSCLEVPADDPNTSLVKPQKLSCDFNDGSFCSWEKGGKGKDLWAISDAVAISQNDLLPKHGHMTSSIEGRYAFVASGDSNSKESRLQVLLTDDNLEPGRYCMSFWSVTSTADSRTSVTVMLREVPSSLRTFPPKTGSWAFFEEDFKKEVGKDLNVWIEADTGRHQVTAVDDIEFHLGSCDSLNHDRRLVYHCTFEDRKDCGVAVEKSSTAGPSWKITGDSNDHTTYFWRHQRHSMMVNMKKSEVGSSKFYTAYVHPREQSCVSLWYKMETKADPTVQLTVKLVVTQQSDNFAEREAIVFTDSGFRGFKQWHALIYQVEYNGKWRLAIEVNYGAAENRDQDLIAIDDIVITRGECPSILSCDFSDKNCPWTSLDTFPVASGSSVNKLDVKWERVPSAIAEIPEARLDSQGKSGSYLMLSGKTARSVLMSPRLEWPASDSENKGCLFIWAFQSGGAEVGVYSGTGFDGEVMKIKGQDINETKRWHKLHYDIEQTEKIPYFWLYIEGLIREESFLAIDDISVTFGDLCPVSVKYFRCDDGTSIEREKRCDFHNDCQDGSDEVGCSYECDFADDALCGYQTKSENKFNQWTKETPDMKSQLRNSPAHFIYTQPSRLGRAELHSVVYRNTGPSCRFQLREYVEMDWNAGMVHFAVELSADNQRRIEVYDGSTKTNYQLQQLRQKSWEVDSAFLGRIQGEFQLIVSFDMKYHTDALVAIDNFEFLECVRNDFAETDCEDQFHCANHKCIPFDRLCDGQNDCEDNSDESSYGPSVCDANLKCNFDDPSFCGSSTSGFELSNGKAKLEEGPTRDHTSNSHYDYFALTKSLQSSITLLNPAPKTAKCVTFYVQAWTKSAKMTVDGRPESLWVSKSGFWQQFNVVADGNVNLNFTKHKWGWIAIDDVVFKQRCKGDSSFTAVPVVTSTLPVVTSTSPSVRTFSEINYVCSKSGGKVPMYTVCDDVLDCPRGEDETRALCGETKCASGGIYCQRKPSNTYECLTDTNLYCDGKADCVDASDEDPRLCNSDIWCEGWCKRGGECKSPNGRLDSCSCQKPFYGKRCQYPDVEPVATTPQTPTTRQAVTNPVKPATKAPIKPPTKRPAEPTEATTERRADIIESAKKTTKSSGSTGAIFGVIAIVVLLSTVAGYYLYTKRPWQRDTGGDTQAIVSSFNGVQMDEVDPGDRLRSDDTAVGSLS